MLAAHIHPARARSCWCAVEGRAGAAVAHWRSAGAGRRRSFLELAGRCCLNAHHDPVGAPARLLVGVVAAAAERRRDHGSQEGRAGWTFAIVR